MADGMARMSAAILLALGVAVLGGLRSFKVCSVVGMQLPPKELGAIIAEIQGDAHTQTCSSSGSTRYSWGTSLVELKPAQLAIQSLVALLGAVVTNSAVGGEIFLLAGTAIGAAAVSTEQNRDVDENKRTSPLKHLFLGALFLQLLMRVFHRNGGAGNFVLAAMGQFRRQAIRLVWLGPLLF